ncbi:TonB-dependent receptor [Noviherbaspirillum malthae]|uniref:TonB-dependent receptor n=1 Tax=Noviherbaspirillum malthae TaxID=1260987 RepID=UPI001E502997|nr:TonB-dependent siderophore receptor [Noviherbaspirillum malthae]
MKHKLVKRPIPEALHFANAGFEADAATTAVSARRQAMLPLGALMLAASVSAWAQTSTSSDQVMPTVEVKGQKETESKESVRTTTTSIGKGQQDIRDIPQSITVMTEKLMDDAKLSTLREALHYTAGITFAATENGTDQDIRLRGFPVATTGDLLIDGMRDPSQYDRDTFNYDRVEVMRGSASMLFGRGSTGGVINQVTKKPFLADQHEVTTSIGNEGYKRLTGDFNFKTGDDAAFRLNVMRTKADNKGAEIDKYGIAPTFGWGIGTRDEFNVGLFHLDSDNIPQAGIRYLNGNVPDIEAGNFYGTNSDYIRGKATYGTLGHIHRFDDGAELRSQLRVGKFDRSQWGTTAGFATGTTAANLNPATVLNRVGLAPRMDEYKGTYFQSDYNNKFNWFGLEHKIIAGIDASSEEADRFGAAGVPGTNFAKGSTTVGNPNNGATLAVSPTYRPTSDYSAKSFGAYIQDLVQVAPAWKLLGGVRFDKFEGDFAQLTYSPAGVATRTTTSLSDSPFSYRAGVLYQPTPASSFHLSYGTSFNTSADTYQYVTPLNANTPPEKSRNIELGAKLDWLEGKLSTRAAIFRTEKYNERTTDSDFAGTAYLLSGRRHSQGVEFDVVGRLTPKWEIYLSYSFIPTAKIDQAGSTQQAVVGSRVGLTPKHTGAAWLSYQATPQLRLAGGVHGASENRPLQGTNGAASTTARASGYVVGDLMAEYVFNETWSAQFNVNNVTNKTFGDQLYPGFVISGPARSALLTVTARF